MANTKRLYILLGLVAVIAAASVAAYLLLRPRFGVTQQDGAVLPSPEILEDRAVQNDIIMPVGKLIVTQLRAAYKGGDMRLVIPKLDLNIPVLKDTLPETLAKGPGLYKYAQIPNAYNTNTSIAAHRDLYGNEFYYLDTLEPGDEIFLYYQGNQFLYHHRSTEIVEPDNWDPIRVFYDCRVTLTTCDPIGTSAKRMIAVGELVEIRKGEPPAMGE